MQDYKTIGFLTCGHVDDGKSTLIGRLLYDIGVVPEDQIAAARGKDGALDYSLFTDGLEDERRQGITIDVAYRYFRHDGRRYRIADTPGHLEYMRNMAVAALASDIAVILVDAVHGVRLQTVQYSKIARFFGVRQFLLAVNKMDAVDYSEARFNEIRGRYISEFCEDDKECTVTCVPVSALAGDNIAEKSSHTPWYAGPTILEYLQNAELHTHANQNLRLPIQHVIKDEKGKRWYLGTLHGKALRVGDHLVSVDSRQSVTVSGIYHSGKPVEEAQRRQAIAVNVLEDVDLTRGSVLSRVDNPGPLGESFYADILWLDKKYEDKPAFQGMMKTHHQEEQVQLDIKEAKGPLKTALVCLARPAAMDLYAENPYTGLFILIDSYTERAVGVGTVTRVIPVDYQGASAI